jgi:hypothetical protein
MRLIHMTTLFGRFVAVTVGLVVSAAAVSAQQQAPRMVGGCPVADPVKFHACAVEKTKAFNPPRTPDGVPNISGYWDRLYLSQDIEEHGRDAFNTQAGPSIVVDTPDRRVPYQPWAMELKKKMVASYISPLASCFSPGVPRWVVAPGPHQIVQTPGQVFYLLEFAHSHRVIPTTARPHVGSGIRLFNGDSRGRWDGNTLVVDVTNANGRTWIDNAGNYYSDRLHVVERFTMMDADSIHYEARIEDPQVYTRPWTMVSALVRNKQPDFQFFEQACHEGNRSIESSESIGMKIFQGVAPPRR